MPKLNFDATTVPPMTDEEFLSDAVDQDKFAAARAFAESLKPQSPPTQETPSQVPGSVEVSPATTPKVEPVAKRERPQTKDSDEVRTPHPASTAGRKLALRAAAEDAQKNWREAVQVRKDLIAEQDQIVRDAHDLYTAARRRLQDFC